ncbi:GTPase Era, mitochondrial-like [Sitodiplosis mosellana]|uniref:GTPase Era, mitochondrial-like n=1 Tax=Sitodiplosis mosellana TaxID=263140 RepID=UPI00244478D4|nr:GTPase Era, mitochondrial-like [Sitodiplosis mosellana]
MEGLLILNKLSLKVLSSQFNQCTIFVRRLCSVEKQSVFNKNSNDAETKEQHDEVPAKKKTIKVAIIGAPNSGKSSFINKITNHRTCPTSRKVHTTLTQSTNIYNKKNTQMILFDTPGFTTVKENIKYNLNDEYIRACNSSIENADLIALIHDVSDSYTRNVVHPTILEALVSNKSVPSILIMNKIDMVLSKRILINLVQVLTEGTLTCKERQYLPWKGREEKFLADMKRPVKYKNDKSVGWPYFSEVFLVSAICGDGVERVANYISKQSRKKPWEYPEYQFTDQRPEDLIINNVRAALLDFLPKEIPYQLQCEMELFEVKENRIHAHVNIHAKKKRHKEVISGVDNKRLKQISEVVESNIIELYNSHVSIVLNVFAKT